MRSDELHGPATVSRIWEEIAEATLELSDREIEEVVRSGGRDPAEVVREARLSAAEAIARARGEGSRRRPGAPWAPPRLDFCLADLGRRDLLRPAVWQALGIGYLLIPALVAGLVALVLLAADVPRFAVAFGSAAAALIAWSGTFACGATVSVVAAGVGGIPLSVALGVTYGFLLRSLGSLDQAAAVWTGTSPVVAGLGGLPGLVRPAWFAVALVALAVGLLSLAMGWVRGAAGGPRGIPRVAGILLAVLVSGLGPGLVFGISALAGGDGASEGPFAVALAVVGGGAFGVAAGLRSGSLRRGVAFGLTFSALVVLLLLSGRVFDQPLARLLVSTTLYHVLLQGTFFALAYVLGERSGGPRGGAAASSIEGIGGYLGFLLVRHGL